MSFGFSPSDVITLGQLAWTTFNGAKRACGEHDELTRELSTLVTVLDHVQSEISDPESSLNMAKDHRLKDLKNHLKGCLRHVRQMNDILIKYNSLSSQERESGSLWDKVRFGNGAVKDIAQIRRKISTYTSAVTISLNLLSSGTRGEAERQLSRQLRGITESVNLVVAKLNTTTYEGSICTKYTDDDPEFWRNLRRQLVRRGYKSKDILPYESLIQAYVKELDSRGVLNDDMRRSQSSTATESKAEGSRLPELNSDQVDIEVSPETQNEPPAPGNVEVHTSGPSNIQSVWLQGENTENETTHTQEGSFEDFELMPDLGHVREEQNSSQKSNNHYAEEAAWQEGDELEHAAFSPIFSKMAAKISKLERVSQQQQQLFQAMSQGEETTEEGIRVYKLLPSKTNIHPVKYTQGSSASQPQVRALAASDLPRLSKPEFVTINNTAVTYETSNQDADTPTERETLASIRYQEFRALPSKERKIRITLQDPNGRKLPFPYFLVKTWAGMEYLIDQALSNIDDLGTRVVKGEYDLINSDGEVIIPHVWEDFVEPEILVAMQMWPAPSPPSTPALTLAESIPDTPDDQDGEESRDTNNAQDTEDIQDTNDAQDIQDTQDTQDTRDTQNTQARQPTQEPPRLPRVPPTRPWTAQARPPTPPRPSQSYPKMPPPSLRSNARPRSIRSSHTTSSKSSRGSSTKSSTWSLFWSSKAPSKPKPKPEPKRTLNSRLPPPPSPWPYRTYECSCWECQTPHAQQEPVLTPLASAFKTVYGEGVVVADFKLQEHPTVSEKKKEVNRKAGVVRRTEKERAERRMDKRVENERWVKKESEILETIDEIEPIFEIDGQEIYELE